MMAGLDNLPWLSELMSLRVFGVASVCVVYFIGLRARTLRDDLQPVFTKWLWILLSVSNGLQAALWFAVTSPSLPIGSQSHKLVYNFWDLFGVFFANSIVIFIAYFWMRHAANRGASCLKLTGIGILSAPLGFLVSVSLSLLLYWLLMIVFVVGCLGGVYHCRT
jgi:hypothetical protein